MADELIHKPETGLVISTQTPKSPAQAYLESANLKTEASRRTMRGVLDRAAKIFDKIDHNLAVEDENMNVDLYPWAAPGAITATKVGEAVAIIASEKHGPYARLMSTALKSVARFAWRTYLLSLEERARIDDVEAPSLSDSTRGRRLTDEEIARIAHACAEDPRPIGRRDAALFALALGGALRRFELAQLSLADYIRPSKLGHDPVTIKIQHGKGDEPANQECSPDVAVVLERWLAVRGRTPGPLLLASKGRGQALKQQISPAGVHMVAANRAASVGITLATHDLRRTSITRFLERTGDLSLAQKFARHQDPKTTGRYDMRATEELRRALAKALTGF